MKAQESVSQAIARLRDDEVRQKLAAAIGAEYAKPNGEADTAFINTCEDLLMALDAPFFFENRQAEHCRALLDRAHAREQAAKRRKRVLSAVAAAAAVLMLLVASDSLLHWVGLVGRSMNHEQQYSIGGMEIDPALIASGSAQGELPTSRLTTKSYDDAMSLVGLSVGLPTALPAGYAPSLYAVERGSSSVSVVVEYQGNTVPLHYFLEFYEEAADVEAAFAAVSNGTPCSVEDRTYWISQKGEELNCLWRKDYAIYQLRGALEQRQLIDIANSITPGQETEGFLLGGGLVNGSLEDSLSVLGFTPPEPAYIPSGASIEKYYVYRSDDEVRFSRLYHVQGEKAFLNCMLERYQDAESIPLYSNGFEQNCEGRTLQEQGVSYYIAYNCEIPFVVWSEGLTQYFLTGPLPEEELLRMAVSMNGGDAMKIPLGSVGQPVALVTDRQAIQIARDDLEAKYGIVLGSDYSTRTYILRLSETRSDVMVEFQTDENAMWNYAARINAQTGEVVASIDEQSWEPYSGALLQPSGYEEY